MRRGRRYVSRREKQARARRMRRRLMVLGAALALAALAMAPDLRKKITGAAEAGIAAVRTFAEQPADEAELTLEEKEVYALQLAVFDSGERAAQEQKTLTQAGIPCIIWQREKMRIVCSAAHSREALDWDAAKGKEGYVIKETLPEVSLRLSAAKEELLDAAALLTLPDDVFDRLFTSEELEEIVAAVQEPAQRALTAHPEHALYTQLAQSLVNWCALMEKTMEESDEQAARTYAQVTMCTLCRELRQALQGDQAS